MGTRRKEKAGAASVVVALPYIERLPGTLGRAPRRRGWTVGRVTALTQPVCARKGEVALQCRRGCLGGFPYRPAPPVGRHRDADFLYPRTL